MIPTRAELIARLQRQVDAWVANEALLFASEREQLQLYRALVETLRAEGDWQPIETAPRNYRVRVLVYDASWCGGAPRITATHWIGHRTIKGEVVEEKGGFIGVTKPTHWRPLPAPPLASDPQRS